MKQITITRRELPYEIAEELKTLRTNIQFCGENIQVILLTSCISGEGKSTLSLELARSFAELGKRVLLVDADLRKSVLKDKVEEGHISLGMTHYLVGQCKLEDVLYATQDAAVHVVPAGPVPPNPSELLSTGRFAQLVETARAAYDYVIIDCAPLGLVVDAAVVAPRCDGSVLVVEAGGMSYRLAMEVRDKLTATRCPILGVVLNKVDRRSDKYYSYGYGKYGKYYEKKYAEYYK
jgi:capsular exopolysaccharide synthesis family protein